ncbi:toll/interleukin-1 receptor domain-containing protein [Microbacterium algihabitans]|uniref:toll/interleukin-1 receptor domain-containing protein n=1 Tax=Microbacterium algihabitans TaxID=3075992 RepID=UPI002905B3C0|nr:toll/interleukin-1 receptor domain-containing protein [Microbacterium sp. KSW2-21]
MPQCTAPINGHTRGGGANCPVHGRGGGYGYAYSTPRSYPSYSAPAPAQRRTTPSRSSGTSTRPSWQPTGSSVSYTPQQVRDLQPVRTATLARTVQQNDVFLCHAWPDRLEAARDVHELMLDRDLSVWFSEVSLRPGTDMRAAIDRGLVSSRMGIVLVTPAMLEKLGTDRSIASNELSALLRRSLLVPIMHGTTFEELDQVTPTLASRGGFSTAEESMESIIEKIAELVGVVTDEEADELAGISGGR